MIVPSLFDLCVDRTLDCLVAGVWNGCPENPFSQMPFSAVDKLMKTLTTRPCFCCCTNLYLLFSSGRLTWIDLNMRCPHHFCHTEIQKVIKMMTPKVCQNVRTLSVPSLDDEVIADLLRKCPKLECFRAFDFGMLGVLTNCPNLRSVRLENPVSKPLHAFSWDSEKLSMFLRDLEIFDVFRLQDISGVHRKVANMLLHCPKLISLGQTDSSLPIEYIHERLDPHSLGTHRFALKRAFWGKKYLFSDGMDYCEGEDTHSDYVNRYPDIIEKAALSCPLLEQLIIKVYHRECIPHLRHLQRLNVLSIDFMCDDEDCVPTFLTLLRDIGHQLRHLSIDNWHKMPLNTICELCPYLLSLKIRGSATVSEPVQNCKSLRSLKRLYAYNVDRKCLIYLLQNCVGLQVLGIDHAHHFDDDTLREVLEKNRLPDLKALHIGYSSLSIKGLEKLRESSLNLKNPYFFECLFDKYHF
ncbi:uncharacterized protein CDAR_522581 [Caerostris darwini]|uniref:Uncharacterized protein n=1 Tax=Caerostris darwini TaxID=1538125 RepID=A0AAV4VPQ6_9ARAC|nr:uncharacterized protein CDAR_522581 [Caerostris darwini]